MKLFFNKLQYNFANNLVSTLPCSSSLIEGKLKKTADESVLELQNKLKSWAKAHHFSLETKTAKMKSRDKKAVCKCFHGVGVVVPVDKNGIGYRPVPESHRT